MDHENQVFVTGAGCVTAAGTGISAFWDAALSAKQPDLTAGEGGRVAAVPEHPPHPAMPRNLAYVLDRASLLALEAALEAVESAGLAAGSLDSRRIAVVDGLPVRAPNTPAIVVPYGDLIARVLGVKGPVLSTTGADASGAAAIAAAYDLLMTDAAEVVIAGASQVVQPELLETVQERGLLTESACRPLDKDRTGMIAGEAAAYLVLEKGLQRARERSVSPLAELSSAARTFDPLAEPLAFSSAEGLGRAYQAALGRIGAVQNEVDLLVCSASGAVEEDRAEKTAVRRIFGNHALYLSLTSFKGSTGHTFSSSGPLQAIAAALALRAQRSFPTANFSALESDEDLEIVKQARDERLGYVLTSTPGMGGHNVALLLGPPPKED